MEEPKAPGKGYANYVLAVLVIVYVFNFIDRQILSILAEDVKADLGLDDAQIGFLYGTAFAVFYAVFGIPLSRLADLWVRKSLIAVGLAFWSAMTALSGTARSFGSLAAFRIGVGVGESSASPAAFSMLGDYFPPARRATAVAIYSSGVYIGAGLGMLIGGQVVDRWNGAYPDITAAPFGLVGWQVAFLIVGLPGLLMAVWVWTLREPTRGASEGIVQKVEEVNPLSVLIREMAAVLPPLTLVSIFLAGGGVKGVILNLGIAAALALGAWGLIEAVGSASQWIALGLGLYCFFSWLQGFALRDRITFGMVYKSKAIVIGMIGFAWLAFVGYGFGFWMAPYFQRVHGVSAAEAGFILGLPISALGGWLGVTAGGVLSDVLRARYPKARPYVGIFCALSSVPFGFLVLASESKNMAYVFAFFFQICSSCWIGSAVAMSNELVMPRMRATSSAYYILVVTFIGLALGPYSIGQVSTVLSSSGGDSGEALRTGMGYGLGAYLLAVLFLWISSRFVVQEEESRLDRARALGEDV
ncbi:MAG: MFS transporter [Acidobacteriota bacterium]